MKTLEQIEIINRITSNLLELERLSIESGLENVTEEYKVKIVPEYLKHFIWVEKRITELLSEVHTQIVRKTTIINKINIYKKTNIRNHKKKLNMLNHLVVLKDGTYYIPYVDDRNNMKYAKITIFKRPDLDFCECDVVNIDAGMFKNIDIISTKFFKGAKEISKILNGKNFEVVEMITPQLFIVLYNNQIKNYKK